MDRLFKIFIFGFSSCLMLSGQACFAQIETYTAQADVAHFKVDSAFSNQDGQFTSPGWSSIQNLTVKDAITLRLRDTAYLTNLNYTVSIQIQYYTSPTSAVTTVDTSLTISYRPGQGLAYKGMDNYVFQGAFKTIVTITGFNNHGTFTPGNGILQLSSSIVIDRRYPFLSQSAISPAYSIASHQLNMTWSPVLGAQEYDVEWTTINDGNAFFPIIDGKYNNTITISDDSLINVLNQVFRNNASRITHTDNACSLTMLSTDTYLLVRMRQAQYTPSGVRLAGTWDYSNGTGFSIWSLSWNEPNINWQYSAAYAEQGKKKEVISYFDGTLRGRQTVTISNTDTVALAQENIYDEFGRPTASILPAPYKETSGGPYLHYITNFNLNPSDSSYNAKNIFHTSAANCEFFPDSLKTASGASGYYSAHNQFLSNRTYNKYIPDAGGYPLSVTQYTPDNTGRIKLQGGVGALFQPGQSSPSKTTKYYYGKPDQWELDQLFGNDVGYAEHYLKNMVVDPNGQISVSYLNASGKTIATALAGSPPSSLDTISTYKEVTPYFQNIHVLKPGQFTFNSSDLVLSASTTYLNAVIDTGRLYFNVQQLIDQYPGGAFQICSNCYYNMTVTVMDECNDTVAYQTTPIGSLTPNPADTLTYYSSLPLNFSQIGEYYITVSFAFDSNVINSYTDNFISQGLRNGYIQQQFNYIKTRYLDSLNVTGCYADCTTCSQLLGGQSDFVQVLKDKFISLNVDDQSVTSTVFNDWAKNLYDTLETKCAALQSTCTYSPCSSVQDQMELDVSPGGQYALFDSLANPIEPAINVISMTTPGNAYPNWRMQFPVITDTSDSTYRSQLITLNDSTITSVYDASFTLQDLVNYWKPEWAVNFLIYDPEYCQLQFCMNNSASESWDLLVQQTINNASNVNQIPNGSGFIYSYTNASDWLLSADPFFMTGATGAPYKSQMQSDLLNYSKNVLMKTDTLNGVKGLMAYVDYMLYCSNPTGTTNTYSSSSYWTNCIPNPLCRVPDREWNTYKSLYFQLKNKYYALARSAACSGSCPVGQPLVVTLPGACPATGDFSILPDTGSVCTGQQSLILSHGAGTLGQNVRVSLYYPPAVDTTSLTHYIAFNSGDSQESFCVPNGIDPSTILVQSIICGTVPNNPTYIVKFHDTTDVGYPDPGCPATVFEPRKSWITLTDTSGNLVTATDTVIVTTHYTYYTAENPGVPYIDSTTNNFVIYPGADTSYTIHYIGHTNMECYHGYTDMSFTCISSISGANLDPAVPTCSGYVPPAPGYLVDITDETDPNPPPPYPITCITANQNRRVVLNYRDKYHNVALAPNDITVLIKYSFYASDHITVLDTLNIPLTLPYNTSTVEYQYLSYITSDPCNSFHGYSYQDPTCLKSIKGSALGTSNITNCPGFTDTVQNGIANGCLQVLAIKQSRFPTATSAVTGVLDTASVSQLVSSTNAAIQTQTVDMCTGNATNWMQALTPGLDSLGVSTALRDSLTNALIAVCAAGGDLNHPLGASDLTGDASPASYSAYNSFGNAITTIILGNKKYTPSLNPYIINTLAPYSPPQQATTKTISNTSSGICSLLQQLTMQAAAAGLNLYDYLTATYGSAMTLSQTDVANLQLSCNNCRFILAQDLTLPVFLDPGATGAIHSWQYRAAKDTLLAQFGGSLDTTNVNYQNLFSGFMDQRWGFMLTYDDYMDYEALLLTDTSAILCNKPPYATAPTDNYACVEEALENAVNNGEADYAAYIADQRQLFTNDYISHCSAAQANASITAKQQLYHYTLYYYDQADNLIRTIPPEGVTLLDTSQFVMIDSARDSGDTSLAVYPDHVLRTTYAYNGTNQVVQQSSPDGGTNRYWYDLLSRLNFSQNDKQLAGSNYSYTVYDSLGRITEVGQKYQTALNIGSPHYLPTDTVSSFLAAGTNSQITRTYYDVAPPDSNNMLTGLQQNFLRKRVSASVTLNSPAGYVTSGMYYNYDLDGNVTTVYRQIPGLGTKTIDYEFDLVSGKVNFVRYQDNQPDRFYYGYQYDADNRLTQAWSGTDAVVDIYAGSSLLNYNQRMDAAYSYYYHGPLARMELGDVYGKVQGADYAYTLQGWLKGVNSTAVTSTLDMGGDAGTLHPLVATDAYGYSLTYYGTSTGLDYVPITGTQPFATTFASYNLLRQLYNGNITSSNMNIPQLSAYWLDRTYNYDQLNRITSSAVYHTTSSTFPSFNGDYDEIFSYDGNGNIASVYRTGSGTGSLTDGLFYQYNQASGRLINNQLNYIYGTAGASNVTPDQSSNNYIYDPIGNVIHDTQANIDTINWTVYGKIQNIVKSTSTISYNYDPSENRQSKTSDSITTYYVRDAQGNPLAIYDNQGSNINWRQQELYGSSRLGLWQPNIRLGLDSAYTQWDSIGHKQYELDNHLGNVMATITDKRLQHSTDSVNVAYYLPDVETAQDYYVFGGLMPDRTFTETSSYRYGFNGKENDNEVRGVGNQQDYGNRIYVDWVGRFLSVDPLTKNYPWYTPYQFAGNTPLQAVDMDGLEPRNLMTGGILPAPSESSLKKLKSTDYNFWEDMLSFEKAYSFQDIIDGNSNIRRQEMDKATGSELNTDYYAVTITRLPPGMTSKQLYENVRENFNNFMDYSVATFGTQDPSDKKIWNSTNPTGAVMTFYNPMDDAGVVTSKASSDYWVFTPVWTTDDHRHPLAGQREFGLTDNGNNTFTFYTRGVDRLWSPADAIYNSLQIPYLLKGQNFFSQANQLWNAVMDNVVQYILEHGGSASKTTSFSRRIKWHKDVKPKDK